MCQSLPKTEALQSPKSTQAVLRKLKNKQQRQNQWLVNTCITKSKYAFMFQKAQQDLATVYFFNLTLTNFSLTH